MKTVVTCGRGDVAIAEVAVPEPDSYQCLCRNLVCATCTGTDRMLIQGRFEYEQDYPGMLGHESIGVVVECGSKVKNFRPGDLVLRTTAVYPGEYWCGYRSMWGGFSEYGLVTDAKAKLHDEPSAVINSGVRFQQKLPAEASELDPAELVQLITLKEVAGCAALNGVTMNMPVLVLGAGSVGIAFCKGLKLLGAYPVIVAARSEKQLETALASGADIAVNTSMEDLRSAVAGATAGTGTMRIFDTTGSADYLKSSLVCLAENGRAYPYATYPAGMDIRAVIPAETLAPALPSAEDTVHGAFCSLLKRRAVNLAGLYSHCLPIDMVKEGFAMLDSKEASKVVFDF